MFPKFGENIKNLVKLKDVTISGPLFALHCKFTTVLLFFACATVCWIEYAGQPMQCIIQGHEPWRKPINTFCWINSTFTLPKKTNATDSADDGRVYHTYYQWVGFILFFQGLIFYLPKWMWKRDEQGLMKNLQGEDVRKLCKTEERVQKKTELVNYFVQRLKGHRMYTFKYWGYELLCLLNVVTQMTLLARFFRSHANDDDTILKFPGEQTMMTIFPDLTKCDFYLYGPGGNKINYDALCVLALNVFNRYIFRFMWYWFLALIVILTSLLFYRMLLIFSPNMRYLLLQLPRRKKLMFETKSVAFKLDIADWWVLYSLKKNIDPKLFADVILELFEKLGY